MPRAQTNKLYRTFVKGLITEASPLTFPENASINEDNCVIYRKGNRSRRLGIDLEDNFSYSSFSSPINSFNTQATTEFVWKTVANKGDLSFLVHRVGLTVRFYDLSVTPTSEGTKAFTVDLTPFIKANAVAPETSSIEFASGKGLLFIVGAQFEPLYVEYTPDTDTVTTQRIYIQIRDFKGVDDGLAPDQEPATLTAKHEYNLYNQGWLDPKNDGTGNSVQYFDSFGSSSTYNQPTSAVINAYFTQFSRYPANNKHWWQAKDNTGDFDPELLGKFFTGAARCARGHYVVNAFEIDRTAVSGVTGLTVESTADRPPTTAFYSGRVWFGLNDTVYYSQVLEDKSKAGMCYQEADPTSEDISDLIATDGGVIPIPDVGKITKVLATGGGILVFGTNGIWIVTGTQAGFTATDNSVSKVSPIGCDAPNSIVEAEGQIFWWSKVGIQGMSPKIGQFGPIEGAFDKTNITEQTIQTFYNDNIPDANKKYAKGIYDPATNTVQWLYQKQGTYPSPYVYDGILNFDLTLQAFYPWSVSSSGNTYPYITGVFLTPDVNVLPAGASARPSFIKYVTTVPVDDDYVFSFSYANSMDFVDWNSFDSTGVQFLSYVESGYEILEDAMRDKQATYVFCYFRRTEGAYLPVGDDYTVSTPSSCKFQVKWDWASSSVSGKWSTKIEAYRLTRVPLFSEDDLTFDTGFPIVVTKNKVRGSGRAIQFRFESNAIGKDFDLLGWAVPFTGNTTP